jgi:hypothetical protein
MSPSKENIFRIFASVFFILIVDVLFAKGNTIVLSKQQTFYANVNTVLNFSGNKSDVSFTTWSKDSVKVSIKLRFTHDNRNIAIAESKYVLNNMSKQGNTIYINNNFSLPSGISTIKSIVSISYKIYVPDRITIIINNNYGDCSLSHFTGHVNLNNSYGNININNTKGHIRIFANLCSIEMDYTNGILECETKNTDYILKNLNGEASIKNTTGKFDIQPGPALKELEINTTHSEVHLNVSELRNFNYDLKTKYGKVVLTNNISELKPYIKDGKLYHQYRTANPFIKISTSFNNINIK